ncbi:hypothetical protein BH11GEM1_BH11GEM1_28740 [soil metagenome]
MRAARRDPGAVIISLKAVLAEYPSAALIHAEVVRYGIERYYVSENGDQSHAR